jgi:hypothetical protein
MRWQLVAMGMRMRRMFVRENGLFNGFVLGMRDGVIKGVVP